MNNDYAFCMKIQIVELKNNIINATNIQSSVYDD